MSWGVCPSSQDSPPTVRATDCGSECPRKAEAWLVPFGDTLIEEWFAVLRAARLASPPFHQASLVFIAREPVARVHLNPLSPPARDST